MRRVIVPSPLQVALAPLCSARLVPCSGPSFFSDLKFLHGKVCGGLLADAGSFRLDAVRAGRFRFPPAEAVSALVTEFCHALPALMQRPDLSIEAKCALAMLMFVAIHPFSDGNGRMGRLIGNYVLARLGLPFVVSFCSSQRLWKEAHSSFLMTQSVREMSTHVETCILLAWGEYTWVRQAAAATLPPSDPCALCLEET
jgi:Fic family protein